MHRVLFTITLLGIPLTAPPVAQADFKTPEIGTRIRWACTGPQSSFYESFVTGVKDGLIRYEGLSDGGRYWIEQARNLTGTTLWNRKIHDQFQWFHSEQFDGLEKAKAGARFRGAVAAMNGESKWVWNYEVSVDRQWSEMHPVLGSITLVRIVERRTVYHGDYWSRMTSDVSPQHGITTRWTYEDPAGVERCELTEISPHLPVQ